MSPEFQLLLTRIDGVAKDVATIRDSLISCQARCTDDRTRNDRVVGWRVQILTVIFAAVVSSALTRFLR